MKTLIVVLQEIPPLPLPRPRPPVRVEGPTAAAPPLPRIHCGNSSGLHEKRGEHRIAWRRTQVSCRPAPRPPRRFLSQPPRPLVPIRASRQPVEADATLRANGQLGGHRGLRLYVAINTSKLVAGGRYINLCIVLWLWIRCAASHAEGACDIELAHFFVISSHGLA